MKEEEVFLNTYKAALESGPAPSEKTLQAICEAAAANVLSQSMLLRRRRMRLSLAAASIFVLFIGASAFMTSQALEERAERRLVETIALLDTAELLDPEVYTEEDTTALLLAWQDVPFTQLVVSEVY